jgi:TonB family protein
MAVARSAVVWIGCLAFMSSLCLGAERQQTPAASTAKGVQDEQASFDMSSQPLVTALRAYSEVTGIAVLVDDGLTAGRTAHELKGRFTPAEALRRLLDGTGLVTRYASPEAFTLALKDDTVASSAANDDAVVEKPGFVLADRYASGIQTAIEDALCRSGSTRPGRYRLAMQLWVTPSGTIERTNLLDSAGSEALDAEILATLRGLHVDAPPAGMPQPLTILMLPRALDTPFVCRTGEAGNRHAAEDV